MIAASSSSLFVANSSRIAFSSWISSISSSVKALALLARRRLTSFSTDLLAGGGVVGMGFILRSAAALCWVSPWVSVGAFGAALAGVATGAATTPSTFVPDIDGTTGLAGAGSEPGAGCGPFGGGAGFETVTGGAILGAFTDLAAVGKVSVLMNAQTTFFVVGTGAFAFLGVSNPSNINSRFTEGFGTGGTEELGAFASSTEASVDALDKTVGGVTGLSPIRIHGILSTSGWHGDSKGNIR